MQKSNQLVHFVYYPAVFICSAVLLGGIEWISAEWLQLRYDQVKTGVIFLTGLYLFLYYPFVFIQKRFTDKAGFIFLILMMLKLVFVIGFLFLFLNPTHNENKREILLFLMNYFVLLVVDMAVKVRLMK